MLAKNCAICGSLDCRISPNRFFKNTLWRCQKCGLIFVNPQPKFNQIKEIYNQHYFKNNNSNSIGYENYAQDKPNIIKTFEKRWRQIEKLYQNKGNVLDLGCAMGFFLEVAKNHNWQTYGVELSNYASQIAQKFFGDKITNGSLSQTCFSEEFFDIITLWDYLEHIPNPANELTQVWHLLKKGGLIILSTPNTASWPHKIFKNKWMGYKDQEHLFYFSTNNVIMLLEKVGFKILKNERIGKYVSLALFAKRLALYNKFLANIFEKLIPKTYLSQHSFYVNPLDIICIYAQK